MSKHLLLVEPASAPRAWTELSHAAGLSVVVAGVAAGEEVPGIAYAGSVPATPDAIRQLALAHRVRAIVPGHAGVYAACAAAAESIGLPFASIEAPAWQPDAVWGAWQKAGLPIVPAEAVADVDAAKRALAAMPPPVRIEPARRTPAAFGMLVRDAADVELVARHCATQAPGAGLWLRTNPVGREIAVLAFQAGRTFHPIELIGIERSRGFYAVPMTMQVPCGLGGRAYMQVLDLARHAGATLPPGHGLVHVSIVLGDAGPVLADARPLCVPPPGVVALLHRALGIELDVQFLRLLAEQEPIVSASRDLAAVVQWPECIGDENAYRSALEAQAAQTGIAEVYVSREGALPKGHVQTEVQRDRLGYIVGTAPTIERARPTVETRIASVRDSVNASIAD